MENPKSDGKNVKDSLECKQCDVLGEISFPCFHRNQKKQPARIKIKNLPKDINENGIKNLFLSIGKPLYIQFNPRKLTAIVEFASWNEAELAVRDLDNTSPYYLKVSVSVKLNKQSEFEEKITCNENNDINAVEVEVEELPKMVSSENQHDKNESVEENIRLLELELQEKLKSLNYDPSIRMRQKKLDYTSKWDCISFGRGYFLTRDMERTVGGLQTFISASEDGLGTNEVISSCLNCNSLTTRICTQCSSAFCSDECSNNSIKNHGCNNKLKGDNKDGEKLADQNGIDSSSDSDDSFLNFEFNTLESDCTVLISTYCTLQTVYVRRIDEPWNEKFVKLCNEVAIAAAKGEQLQDKPKVGGVYITKYYKDLCFYRAQVSDLDDEKATVIFIDFGNTQVTNIEDLYPLPSHLEDISAAAVKVVLKNVPKGSSLQSVNYFNKLTAERIPLILKFKKLKDGVILLEKDSNQEVNTKVTNYSMPTWKKDNTVISKLSEVFFMEVMKLKVLDVGKSYNLRISHFDEKEFLESRVVWATDVETDDYLHVIGEMKERITEYCEFLKDDCYLPRVNELCLAKEKGEWHRCVNLRIQRTTCFLFFIDDGHSSFIDTVNIRKTIKDFIEAPSQAVCFVLSNDLELKKSKELESKVVAHLKGFLGKVVNSIFFDKFLGDIYCVTIPEINQLLS